MRLTQEDNNTISVIHIHGDLAGEDVPSLRKLLETKLQNFGCDFVLDLREMEFLDSQGMETILWLQDRCGEKLGQVRLAGAHANVRKILEVTRLLPRFDLHADVDSALQSLRI